MKYKVFAFLFPGQGSQSIGMLSELAACFSVLQETFSRASLVLGYDLWRCVSEGLASELDRTEITQPALLTASMAIWYCWRQLGGPLPDMLAGHSLGEYTALAVAGALSLEEAVRLVHLRGKFMQSAVPAGQGAMGAIIGLENASVEALCKECSRPEAIVAPANFNAKGQVVIAGEVTGVEKALGLALQQGAKLAKKLAVSVPSHCALMQPAASELTECLAQVSWQMPSIPVFQNLTANPVKNIDELKQGLVAQLVHPVRWVETIENMMQFQVASFMECGPGKVLAGLNKRIVAEVPVLGLESPRKLGQALMWL